MIAFLPRSCVNVSFKDFFIESLSFFGMHIITWQFKLEYDLNSINDEMNQSDQDF